VLGVAWLAAAALVAPPSGQLAVVRDGAVLATGLRALGASQPAWSRNGEWLAFVGRSAGNPELYVARPGSQPVRLTYTARQVESAPSWSPDGTRLAYAGGDDLYVTTLDGSRVRVLIRNGSAPAWSPDGRRLAFERNGDLWTVSTSGRGTRRLTAGSIRETAADWSPDGRRLVYSSGDDLYVRRVDRVGARFLVGNGAAPSWSPDGRRVAFERGGSVWAVSIDGSRRARLRAGGDPDWRPRPTVREHLPDIEQRAPGDLSIIVSPRRRRPRFLLGFTSAAANGGAGPIELIGSRSSTAERAMSVEQRIHLSSGGVRRVAEVGKLRYQHSDDHHHWHFAGFMRYELRRIDGAVVARDRKSGFCLVDRHGPPGRRRVFVDNCQMHNLGALRVRQGTSPGFVDIYPAHFHGQNIDVTAVPAGVYLLVHRSNPLLALRESDYTNDAASLLIRLSWPDGPEDPPVVRALRRCLAGDRCPPRSEGLVK
jgi:hypothetical protein